MRPIDADAIHYDIHKKIGLGIDFTTDESDTYLTVPKTRIDAMPTANVVPIKYGTWERFRESPDGPEHIKCSICGQFWSIADHDKFFKRCFKCGAIMNIE